MAIGGGVKVIVGAGRNEVVDIDGAVGLSHKNDNDKLQTDGTQKLSKGRIHRLTQLRLLVVLLSELTEGVNQFGVKESFNIAPDVYTHLSCLFVRFNPIQHSIMGEREHNHSACNCCDFVFIVAR